MSEWSGTIPELLFTFVQSNEPSDVEEGMTWYDLDSDTVWLFTDDSGSKTEFTVVDHAGLAGVGPADHHNPVTPSGPISVDADQTVGLSIANALAVVNGDLAVQEGQISHDNLGGVSANDHHSQTHDNSDHTTDYLPQSEYNPSLESGSFQISASNASQGETTQTVSFAATYEAGTVSANAACTNLENAASTSIMIADISEFVTDSDGNITGMVVLVAANGHGQTGTIDWHAQGNQL